jgi:hypothetical protein
MVDDAAVADRMVAEAAAIIVAEDVQQHPPREPLPRTRGRRRHDIAERRLRQGALDAARHHAKFR